MKRIIAIIVTCSLIIQCFVHLGMLSLYELKRESVAHHICSNSKNPGRVCCMKCYLRKQLKQEDCPSKDCPLKAEKQSWTVFILPAPMQPLKRAALHGSDDPSGFRPDGYRFRYSGNVFRPPAFA